MGGKGTPQNLCCHLLWHTDLACPFPSRVCRRQETPSSHQPVHSHLHRLLGTDPVMLPGGFVASCSVLSCSASSCAPIYLPPMFADVLNTYALELRREFGSCLACCAGWTSISHTPHTRYPAQVKVELFEKCHPIVDRYPHAQHTLEQQVTTL